MPDKNKVQQDKTRVQTIQDSRRAADAFLRAGRRRELNEERAGDLADRFREMSDEDFDRGVADGSITPEQIRKAGEYDFDVYMGDVWVEKPENDGKPEPSYDEFMADPAKYGYDTAVDHMKFSRYNPNRYKNQ